MMIEQVDKVRDFLKGLINPYGTWKFSKTAKKVAINSAIVLLTGLATVYANDTRFLLIAPVVWGIIDWLKHR